MVLIVDGTINGYEALLRWHHPTLGEIPPDTFVPIAEVQPPPMLARRFRQLGQIALAPPGRPDIVGELRGHRAAGAKRPDRLADQLVTLGQSLLPDTPPRRIGQHVGQPCSVSRFKLGEHIHKPIARRSSNGGEFPRGAH
jgi:hypothetical protein